MILAAIALYYVLKGVCMYVGVAAAARPSVSFEVRL